MSELSKDIALGPVGLRVADVARSGAWLERVLGLTSSEQSSWGGPDATPLVRLREVPDARRVPRGGRPGLYHYALLLPGAAQLGRFLLHLEAIGERWSASDHLVSEAIYLVDPDGITVEVYADRPRETWAWRGRELAMAVDPLDRARLVAAAGQERWHGLPAGTRMGHLHFFVGDLVEAERFYVRGLGFEPSTRLLPGALFVAAGGYHHHLGLNVWAAGRPVAGPADAGLDEWSLVLPERAELASLVERARAARMEVQGEADALVATDPWALRVRVTVR